DVGSVRLTERFFASRPPSDEAVTAARAFADEALARVPEDVAAVRPVVAVAGTAKVAAALAGAGGAIPAGALRALRDRLLALTPAEALALDPALMAGRADVAAAGLLVLAAATERFGAHALRYSPGGLRHGLALAAAEGAF